MSVGVLSQSLKYFFGILGSTLSEDLLNNDCNGDSAPVDIRVIPASPNGGGKIPRKNAVDLM